MMSSLRENVMIYTTVETIMGVYVDLVDMYMVFHVIRQYILS